jgi:hypothetical protein
MYELHYATACPQPDAPRSPFVNSTLTPTSEVASGTSELCLSGGLTGPLHHDMTEIGSPEEDEREKGGYTIAMPTHVFV